jgi:hypothetical protein
MFERSQGDRIGRIFAKCSHRDVNLKVKELAQSLGFFFNGKHDELISTKKMFLVDFSTDSSGHRDCTSFFRSCTRKETILLRATTFVSCLILETIPTCTLYLLK